MLMKGAGRRGYANDGGGGVMIMMGWVMIMMGREGGLC